MGLLKHVLLPLFMLLDLKIAYDCLVAEDVSGIAPTWAPDRDFAAEPLSLLERHLVHLLGGVGVVFAVNMLLAAVVENSHYRGLALLLHTLFFIVDGFSYLKVGVEVAPAVFGIVGLGLVGMVVHSLEPGIFTKDKTKTSSNKKA